MANQQLFPQSTYPLAGDAVSTPGSPDVTVTGIQTFPFSAQPPLEAEVPVFTSGEWVPTAVTLSDNDSIAVNGTSVSDDYWVFVNYSDTEVQVNSSFAPNGFPILVAGSPAA